MSENPNVVPASVLEAKREERERQRREREVLKGSILSVLEDEDEPTCAPASPAPTQTKEPVPMTRFSSTHLSTRGFGPKLNEIIEVLNAKGTPTSLRPVELGKRIYDEAIALGYDPKNGEIPSRTTIGRRVRIITDL